MSASPRYEDRSEAGRLLAERLVDLAAGEPVVLALPRGGVPVAFEVARRLRAPLDLVMVRKIGMPGHEEFGIGAIVDCPAPQVVMNDDLVARLRPDFDAVRKTMRAEQAELERRRERYFEGRDPVDLEGRTVIVVDDGIATGSTVKAALKAVRAANPAKLILAVPIAPKDTMIALALECDLLVHLETPRPFRSVGQHYHRFDQVTDAEVVAHLEDARDFVSPAAA